jgi:hypothetical protein
MIAHGQLGVILGAARLAVRYANGVRTIRGWSAHATANNELIVTTDSPGISCRFRISGNVLEIATTSFQSVLLARAPAPASRIAARLLDRRTTRGVGRYRRSKE